MRLIRRVAASSVLQTAAGVASTISRSTADTGIWACGECHKPHVVAWRANKLVTDLNKKGAEEECCAPRHCPYCGRRTERDESGQFHWADAGCVPKHEPPRLTPRWRLGLRTYSTNGCRPLSRTSGARMDSRVMSTPSGEPPRRSARKWRRGGKLRGVGGATRPVRAR
jgi:hypothetical protein